MPKNNDEDTYLHNDHFDKDGDGIADKVEENIKPQLEPKYDSFQEAYQHEESLLKGVGSWITETAHGRNTIGRGAGIVLDVAGLVFPPIENIRRKGKKVLRLDERKFKYQPQKQTVMDWFINRLQERSTWRGIIAAATGIGVITLGEELRSAIITAGVAVFALVELVTKEPQSKDA